MSDASFVIMPARASDADRLAALRVEAMRPSLEAIRRFDPDRARNRFLRSFEPADTRLVVCAGELVGFYVLRRCEDHLYLDHLYLCADWQGKGIGRRIVAGIQEEAEALLLPLRLMALRGSPANGFYRSCGFEVTRTDTLDIYYQWRPQSGK